MTPAPRRAKPPAIVAIGCSAGGPLALQEILPAMPPDTPAAILVAQHMPARFTALFAERLARTCALPVGEPADGETLRSGRVYIAPGGRQTTVEGSAAGPIFRIRPRRPEERYAPSADLLMTSAAALFGARVLGILMTGMGTDGVAGLRAIKSGRGRTIVEAESTAVVFGMPREAIRRGLADLVLPRPEIVRALLAACAK
jgi:two-component system chemotaxis response regulator CheB